MTPLAPPDSAAFMAGVAERAAARPRRIIFPEPGDARVLEAVAILARRRLVHPVLLGATTSVLHALERLGAEPGSVELVPHASDHATDHVADHPSEPHRRRLAHGLAARRAHRGWTAEDAYERLGDPLLYAAAMVAAGEVDGFVAGAQNTTGDVIRAAVRGVGTAPGIHTVSSSFYMVIPPFRQRGTEVLTFTDAAVVADPTPQQLADIAAAAVRARAGIVGDEPRVAFLSFSTKGSADHASVTKVREAFESFRAAHPQVIADGEVQLDAAVVESVAARKTPGSELAGTANILVFPNLDAANIGYKLVQRLAHATAIGPILQGLDRPCSDLSRGAAVDDIVAVACVTALQA